ncbi:hypothetical protein LCGC14_0400510 [marine sediment metagenome]|uniref:Uncharacterized protein n=1 Tax=marine sediment metagenome TaxID=412755 RepID=A0A0F9VIX5_9ZZZZ
MAQQVLSLGRLRRPTEGTERGAQAIANLLQTLGVAEKKRRERQTLDRIARAMAGGATDVEAIAAVAGQQQEPQFSGGIPGILQRIGGAFQPQGGGIRESIQQTIIGQRLKQALTPKTQIPTGFEPTGVTVGPTGGVTRRFGKPTTKQQKAYTPNELLNVRKSVQAGLGNLKETRIAGNNAISQDNFIEEYKQKAAEFGYSGASNRQQKQFDAVFDKKARRKSKRFDTSTVNATGDKIKLGWNPNSPEVKQARKELRAGVQAKDTATQEISDTNVRLQSAPDIRLDSVWDRLSDEQKKQILTQIDQNPENLDTIITNILARIQGAGS